MRVQLVSAVCFLAGTLVVAAPGVAHAVCGNGIIDAGETCDDGNTSPGDGCDAGCQVEPCFSCTGQPSSCSCDVGSSGCGGVCMGVTTCAEIAGACQCVIAPVCGNALLEPPEECDGSSFSTACTDAPDTPQCIPAGQQDECSCCYTNICNYEGIPLPCCPDYTCVPVPGPHVQAICKEPGGCLPSGVSCFAGPFPCCNGCNITTFLCN